MDIDEDKIDEAVLALLWLTRCGPAQAWKGHDWHAMDRLHEKGMIDSPRSKAKSVWFTEDGLRASERLSKTLFEKAEADR